jgi:hypothetical protein
MEVEDKFKLRPIISASDKDFRNKIGAEAWEKIKSKTLRDDSYKCQGCGFEPYDVPIDIVLDVHLVEENEENPLDSKFRTTCKLCHIIEHADVAIEQGYVSIVNSRFSQGELVNICRNSALADHVRDGDIRYLRKTLPEFLEELKDGRALEGKVKFVFTEKYLKKFDI